jgi:hypothetical protein
MSPPPPPRRAALLILLVALAAAATYLPTALAAKPPPGPLYAAGTTPVSDLSADEYRASIRPDGAGRRIDQVLGVSLEWPRVGDYENERFARVFALLGPRPILRIGGSSAEMLDEVPGPATWRALRYLAQRAGARFIINLKLSGGDLDFIKALYKRSIAEVGPYVRAFELGNEPKYWPKGTGGYALAPPHAFTPGWPAFNEYYSTVARALVAFDASYPILGPSWCVFCCCCMLLSYVVCFCTHVACFLLKLFHYPFSLAHTGPTSRAASTSRCCAPSSAPPPARI